MADLIQSHKGICSLNEIEISQVFFHSFNTLKVSFVIPLQFDKFFYSSFDSIKNSF